MEMEKVPAAGYKITGIPARGLKRPLYSPSNIGVALDYMEKGNDLLTDEFNMFTDLSIALVSNITQLDVVTTIQLLLSDSYCEGQRVDFEEHFAGNYGELYTLVEFALKENFGNFFTDYLQAKGLSVESLKAMVPKAQTTEESSEK